MASESTLTTAVIMTNIKAPISPATITALPTSILAGLPLSDPRCNDDACTAYSKGHQASQAQISWASQFEYGKWTVYYYMIWIVIFAVVYLSRTRIIRQRPSTSATDHRTTLIQKTRALIRSITYRRFSGSYSEKLGLPSYGLFIFLLIAIAFCIIATFVQRPYYRLHRGFGSPPLAVRTGLMAVALTPLIVALAGKANLVTILTGVSHERLNILHRWTAWLCLALSVVHTIPFIVAPLKEGGPAALHKQYFSPGAYELTGTPPLIVLFFIVLVSTPYIRSRVYEVWVHSHIILGISYLGLMFWHANKELNSWVYLWATLAVWLISICIRLFHKNRAFNLKDRLFYGAPTKVQHLPSNMTKLEIIVPHTHTWRPGQHYFLRFLSISIFDNHPFTVASIPRTYYNGHPKEEGGAFVDDGGEPPNIMTFLIRSHAGFTRKLSKSVEKDTMELSSTSTKAWLDGPYGGCPLHLEHMYNNIICVAGGGGISSLLPWISHLAEMMSRGACLTTQVHLIWIVRQRACLDWAATELLEAYRLAPANSITYSSCITREEEERPPPLLSSEKNPKERPANAKIDSITTQTPTPTTRLSELFLFSSAFSSRPHFPTILPQTITASHNIILGCGSPGLKTDLSNAVAALQAEVLEGKVREVGLWTEGFDW